jgi:hypothetical protein
MANINVEVGRIVKAKMKTGVCDIGETGVVYEQYDIGGRPGWSVIFEKGRYDGFSPDEVERFLEVTDLVDAKVSSYQFINVMKLSDDFRNGFFDSALNA